MPDILSNPTNLRINGPRLLARLRSLAEIGATPQGGCCRLALSDEDKAGRDWLVAQMQGLGLAVEVDRVGNIVGILKGKTDAPALILGSHIDTVATGGRYDGALGVVAGLEVLATMRDEGLMPERDLAVIAFTNEEGARFQPDMLGSLVWAGGLSVEDANHHPDADGLIFADELRRIGYEGKAAPGFLRPHAYLELHIEQGPVLEQEGFAIGAVTGVQGITWLEFTITGQPNHAGTTPMVYRRDAGLLASQIHCFAHEMTQLIPGQLANMGVMRITPSNINVVPERVVMTLDLRNPDAALLAQAEERITRYSREQAEAAGLGLTITDLARFDPVPFAEPLVATVEAASRALGLSTRRIISGAGHDAQMMARLCPSAMIFVPSVGGLSHNPAEFTGDAEVVAGADVLLHVALDLSKV